MKTISVRLLEETYEELVERGSSLGLPPAIMARALIMGGLNSGVDLVTTPVVPEASQPTTTQPTSVGRSKKNRKGKGKR